LIVSIFIIGCKGPEVKEDMPKEEVQEKPKLSKELRKEILTLYKLGLEEYEVRYLLSIKSKKR